MARLRPGKPPLDLPQTLLFCTVLVPVKHNQALIQGRVIQNQAGGQGERILNGTDIPDLHTPGQPQAPRYAGDCRLGYVVLHVYHQRLVQLPAQVIDNIRCDVIVNQGFFPGMVQIPDVRIRRKIADLLGMGGKNDLKVLPFGKLGELSDQPLAGVAVEQQVDLVNQNQRVGLRMENGSQYFDETLLG